MTADFDTRDLPYLRAIATDSTEPLHIQFADKLVSEGYAEGNEKIGYTLTDMGRAVLDRYRDA